MAAHAVHHARTYVQGDWQSPFKRQQTMPAHAAYQARACVHGDRQSPVAGDSKLWPHMLYMRKVVYWEIGILFSKTANYINLSPHTVHHARTCVQGDWQYIFGRQQR